MAITCRWDILSLLAYSDTHKVLYKARRRRQYALYGEVAQRRTGLYEDCYYASASHATASILWPSKSRTKQP